MAEGFDVWWDRGILSGLSWRDEIARQISSARVIVVLWSVESVDSHWVREEAELGRSRGTLCPVLLDDVRPPLGFGELQASNLVGWTGNRSDPAWRYFVSAVARVRSGRRTASTTSPKPRRSPWPKVAAFLGVVAALVTIVTGLVQLDLLDLGQKSAPNVQTARGLAAETTVTAEDQRAWDKALVDRANCDSIRQYVLAFPSGHFVSQAQAILAAQKQKEILVWTPFDYPSSVVASSSLEATDNRDAACESARSQLGRNISDGCAVYSSDPARYRNVLPVSPDDPSCDCRDNAVSVAIIGAEPPKPVWRCTIRATYSCRGEVSDKQSQFACG